MIDRNPGTMVICQRTLNYLTARFSCDINW